VIHTTAKYKHYQKYTAITQIYVSCNICLPA